MPEFNIGQKVIFVDSDADEELEQEATILAMEETQPGEFLYTLDIPNGDVGEVKAFSFELTLKPRRKIPMMSFRQLAEKLGFTVLEPAKQWMDAGDYDYEVWVSGQNDLPALRVKDVVWEDERNRITIIVDDS